MRPIDRETLWSLKAAIRDLISRAGKLHRSEEITGLSTSHLQRCGDPDADCTLNLPAVILLERDTGKPIVTDLLASLSGYRLVPIDGGPTIAAPVPAAFAAAVEETSDLMTTTAAALVDRRVSETEARNIAADATDARDAIDGLTRSVACNDLRIVPRPGGL